MAFNVTECITAVGGNNGTLRWTYSNGSGSINGSTSFTTEQMPLLNPATKSPTQVDAWLAENCGNTTEELDAGIAANNAHAADAANQTDYLNDGGTWVVAPANP